MTECAEPLRLSVLMDYWLGDVAPQVAKRVEEHFLGCASCSNRLRRLVALARSVRSLTHEGLIRAVVTSAFLESLVADGFAVKEYRIEQGGRVECTVTPYDELVASHLSVDLRDVDRVDVITCDDQGREESRLDDIPFNAPLYEVVLLERTDYLRALSEGVKQVRLMGHDAGAQRVLGEYTFVYIRSHDR